MDKNKLAEKIATDLLDNDMLDLNNFSNDTARLLECVQKTIYDDLSDFLIISGKVIEW